MRTDTFSYYIKDKTKRKMLEEFDRNNGHEENLDEVCDRYMSLIKFLGLEKHFQEWKLKVSR